MILEILIIGGSQGAKFFDEFITRAILNFFEQYKNHYIKYKLFDFDENLIENLNDYDLAIIDAVHLNWLSQLCIPFIAIPFLLLKITINFTMLKLDNKSRLNKTVGIL